MNRPIYLDYNATTPVDPLVLESMLPFLREAFGNASSSTHSYGWEANQAVEKARKQAATLIGRADKTKSITWTSGATESNNMALLGVMKAYLSREMPAHMITTLVEHKAVLDVAKCLEKYGAEVTYLKPDRFGQVSARQVEEALKPHTRLISIIMGQNEIGTINPVAEIGALANKNKVVFHVDAAQTLGKNPISVQEMHIDLLSASGHKMYAPKGVGFLYINDDLELEPLLFGGSQEFGRRPGTLNVPGIVAMGTACEICYKNMGEESRRLTEMRDAFIARILNSTHHVRLNGHRSERLSSNVSFSFDGLDADVFALSLSGLAVSSGSACSAGAPSHILEAIGLPESLARATVRIGIGRFTTEEDLKTAAEKIIAMVQKYSTQTNSAQKRSEKK